MPTGGGGGGGWMGIHSTANDYLFTVEKLPGTIIFYLPAKGYGYLRLSGTREEFHFRSANLIGAPVRAGDAVRFVLRQGRQGYYADAVERANIA